MATIARMIVELAADASGVRRAFAETIREAQTYGAQMRRATANTSAAVDPGKFAAMGREAATGMVQSFTRTYEAAMASNREQLARGSVSPAAYRLAGANAAQEFNREVLNGISDLRNNKMLPPDVHQKLVRELKEAGIEAGREARKQVENQLRLVGSTLTAVGREMQAGGRALTAAVTLPIVGVGVASVKMASDAAESANKFRVIMGPAAAEVAAQLGVLHRSIPVTSAALQDATSEFVGLFTAMGFVPARARAMGIEMVRVAGDISSLHNVPLKDVFQSLESGLVGQTRALRKYHIDASEAALAQRALDAGIKGNIETMDRHTKTQLIFNSIVRDSADSMGDAAATAGSAANTFRFLQRDLGEAAITIGHELLPVIVPLVQSLSRVLQVVTTMSPHTLDMAIKFALVAATVGPVLVVLGSLTTIIGGVVSVIAALVGSAAAGAGIAGVIALLAGPAGWIILFGVAAAAIAGWAAHVRGAKTDVDSLQRSFAGMQVPQLSARFTEEARKMQDLQQRAADLSARLAVSGTGRDVQGRPVKFSIQEDRRLRRDLGDTNDQIREQQILLNALGGAWQKQGATEYATTQQTARDLARYNAFVNALKVDPEGETVASIKAAAAAAKAAKAEQREFISELAGTVSSLVDLRAAGVRFGQDLVGIDRQAVATFQTVQAQIDASGGRFDATTAKLFNLRAELLKIQAVATEMRRHELLTGTIDIQHLVNVTPTVDQARQAREAARGGTVVVQPIVQPVTVLPVTPGRIITTPSGDRGPAVGPPEIDIFAARLRVAGEFASTALRAFGRSIQEQLLPIGNAARELVNPIYFFGSVLNEIAGAIRPIFEPLRPVLARLATVVAEGLAPVFEALAPVIDALIPLVRAVMQVIGPILTALAPLFRAIGIILEALFPIFKLVAIAATYVGQVFGIVANIVLRAVGNIIIGLGKIVEAFARAVDALPFVSAKGAIRTAQGIQNFGRSLLGAADEMKNMANEMARARGEISKVNISHDQTAEKVDKLGDAAATAAEQLLFVPQIFRYRARLAETWEARDFDAGTPTTRPGGPMDTTPSVPGGPAAGGGSFHIAGDVIIQTSGDGQETLDELRAAAKRESMATYGTTTRSADIFR